MFWNLLGGSEQLGAVGSQTVDGTVMTVDFTEGC